MQRGRLSSGTLERRLASPPPVLQPPREWDARCALCGQPATQQFHCSGCGLERAYCQQYACQADDWSKHPPSCRGLTGTIFKEDTTITRLSDGTTYSRRRRRSIGSNADLMERMAVLELEPTQIIRPDLTGWLACPGDTLQNWRLLYFVLKDDMLFCFDSDVSRCRGAIALTGFNARPADPEIKTKHAIKMYHLEDGRVHFFVAQSREEAQTWLAAILRAANLSSPESRAVTSPAGTSATSSGTSAGSSASGLSPHGTLTRASFSTGRRAMASAASVDAGLKQLADAADGSSGGPRSDGIPKSTSFAKLLTPAHMTTDAVVERTLLVRAEMLPLGAPMASVRAARAARKPSSLASNWNLGDQLVRVQLTKTLVDSQFEVYDSLSRSEAVSRILDQPAPYPKQAISDMAADLAFDKVAGFVVARANPLTAMFRRSSSASGAAFEAGLRASSISRASHVERDPRALGRGSIDPTSIDSNDDLHPIGLASTQRASSTDSPRGLGKSADAASRSGASSPSHASSKGTPEGSIAGGLDQTIIRTSTDGDDRASLDADDAAARRRALAVLGWPGAPTGSTEADATATPSSSAGATKLSSRRSTFFVRGSIAPSASMSSFAAEMMGIQYGAALKEGWLGHGNIVSARKLPERLWFVLDDSSMRAYETDTSESSVFEVDLAGRLIVEVPPHAFRISRGETHITLTAQNEADCASWLLAMQEMRDTYAPLDSDVDASDASAQSSDRGPSTASAKGPAHAQASDEAFDAELERLVEDIATGKAGSVPPSPQLSRAAGGTATSTMTRFASVESVASVSSIASHVTINGLRRMILYPHRKDSASVGWSAVSNDEMREFQLVEEEPDGKQPAQARRIRFMQDSDKIVYQVHSDGVADVYIVTAAKLDQLVSRLADEELPDQKYIDLFLLGYRHVTTAEDLMLRLLKRFNLVPPPDATTEEADYFARWASIIQLRTLGVVKRWVDQHFEDFGRDAGAWAALDAFLDTVPLSNDALASLAGRLRWTISEREREFEKWKLPPLSRSWGRSKPTGDFLRAEPREFAHQVALLDHERFAAIHASEFATRIWEGNGPHARHISDMIDWFNHLSQFVASTVCRQGYIQKRAVIIQKFIRVMQETMQVHDYNGAMAILSGLSKSAVRRLKKTWELVPAKDVDAFAEVEAFMSADHNFRRYRDRLAKLERENYAGAIVPFMAVFLRDLTFFQDGNPKMLRGELVNFGKLRMIGERILAMRSLQSRKYEFQATRASGPLRSLLEDTSIITDENMLYKCSCYCEPRDN